MREGFGVAAGSGDHVSPLGLLVSLKKMGGTVD
jgi:hypothetical protein